MASNLYYKGSKVKISKLILDNGTPYKVKVQLNNSEYTYSASDFTEMIASGKIKTIK